MNNAMNDDLNRYHKKEQVNKLLAQWLKESKELLKKLDNKTTKRG